MEKRENSRRHWPIAVTVSVLVHGAALLGFSLLSGRQAIDAGTTATAQCVSLFAVEECDTGEVRFEEARAPGGTISSNRVEKKSIAPTANSEPVTATLRDVWAGSAAKESSSGEPEPGATANVSGEPLGGAATSFFQVAARGRKIVYVLDGSASMGKHGALAAACRELHRSVAKLPGTVRFQVIIYNDNPHYLLPRFYHQWLEPTPAVLSEVGAALALAGQNPEGSTEHEPALKEAFALSPDVVFFLTDADDLNPAHVRLVSLLNKGRAIVNTIELNTRNRHRTDMPLQRMARENRGVYQPADLEY
jgi:hypothetical protein